MSKYLLILPIFVSLLAFSSGSVLAQESPNDILSAKGSGDKEVCVLIKDNLKRGVDAKAVTKTNIQLGHNVCYVVKCAIEGGGELKLIITGALEAGSTSDVVTRCCVDAGAEPGMIAQILQSVGEGLGYSPPGDEMIPMDPALRGTTGGRSISPSSF
jgi:hypothetical protein